MKRAGAELSFGCDVGSVGAALLLLLCGACLHVAVWRGVPWREAVSRNAHGGLEGWPPGNPHARPAGDCEAPWHVGPGAGMREHSGAPDLSSIWVLPPVLV